MHSTTNVLDVHSNISARSVKNPKAVAVDQEDVIQGIPRDLDQRRLEEWRTEERKRSMPEVL